MDLIDAARMVFALLFTLALIAGAAYVARRFGMLDPRRPTAGERRLRITESLMLDPRRRLVVVRFDDRDLLLLLSPAGDRSIAETPARVGEASS